ncbi:MAG: hypothetical protein M3463_07300 [Verrucomicrobiota bacterium]|nr:hypothetical protein [Verrucomicrobiota bacterium]
MKKLLSILTIVAFTASAGYAACGKKVTDEGKLTSINSEKKEVTIETADGKKVNRVLTPTSKTTAKDGTEAKADALVGKNVKVVSEHNKIESVSEA